jgi:hypothetical protein
MNFPTIKQGNFAQGAGVSNVSVAYGGVGAHYSIYGDAILTVGGGFKVSIGWNTLSIIQ